MNDMVLQAQSLGKRFTQGPSPVDVFSNLNLSVKRGERIAIVGASGAGKSTLLQLLGGLDKPSAGTVLVNQVDMASLSEKARCRLRNQTLGFIYQFHHLLPEFTVLENVCMPLLIRNTTISDAKSRAIGLLDKVGLAARVAHKLAELSGGERQRVAIVRALIAEPLCLLADEPTGNLDNKTAKQVFDLLLTLHKKQQSSMIIVTHDMQLAKQMDRCLALENGQLIERAIDT